RNYVARFQIAEMAGAILAERRRSVACHVLRHHVARLETPHKQSAAIVDHWGDPVTRTEGVSRANGNRFLAQAGIQTTDDLVLAEQAHHLFLELAVEPHEVIEFEVLFARQG